MQARHTGAPPHSCKRCHSATALGHSFPSTVSPAPQMVFSTRVPHGPYQTPSSLLAMLLIFRRPLGMLFCPDLSHGIKHVPVVYTSAPDLVVILVVTCSGSVTVLALHPAAVENVSHNKAVEISELVRRGHQCDMIITLSITVSSGSLRERTSSVCFRTILSPSQRGQLEGLVVTDLSWVSRTLV